MGGFILADEYGISPRTGQCVGEEAGKTIFEKKVSPTSSPTLDNSHRWLETFSGILEGGKGKRREEEKRGRMVREREGW